MSRNVPLGISLLVLTTIIAGQAAGTPAWWDFSYDADVLPAEAFPAWFLKENQVKSGMTIEDRLADGALVVMCRGNKAYHAYTLGWAGSERSWRPDSGLGTTLEMRLRVVTAVQATPMAGAVWIGGFGSDGQEVTLGLGLKSVNFAGREIPLDLSQFHVLRLTYAPQTGLLALYVDHKPTPVCTQDLKSLQPKRSGRVGRKSARVNDSIVFGYREGSEAQGAMAVSYIRWTSKGALVPDGKTYDASTVRVDRRSKQAVARKPGSRTPINLKDPDVARTNDLITQWSRYPVLAVPFAASVPVIDGTIDVAEWKSASCLRGLVAMSGHHVAKQPSTFYFLHDEKNVYLAFQLDRPDKVKPKVRATGRAESLWNAEDGVELVLSPDRQRSTVVSLYINGGSGYSEGVLVNKALDSTRKGNWVVKSRVTDQGIEGEVQIPKQDFADILGKDRATLDTTGWGFNPLRTDVLPREEQADWTELWGYNGGYSGRRLGTLAFRPDGLAVRLDTPGALDDNHVGIRGTLVNPGTKEVRAKLTYRFYQAITDVKARGLDLYYTWDKVNNIRVTGSDFDEGAAEQLLMGENSWLKNLGQTYQVAKEGTLEVAIPAQNAAVFQAPLDQAGGQFIFAAKLTDVATGQTLWAQTVPVEVKPKLELTVAKRFLTLSGVVVTMDASGSSRAGAGDVLRGQIRQAETGKVVASWETTLTDKSSSIQKVVTLKDCPVGEYRLEATLLAKGTQPLLTNAVNFTKPAAPAWWHNKVGYSDKVPWPFTPVQAKQQDVSVWRRTYRWQTNNAFPNQIVTQGKDLLASPIELKLVAGGQELTWKTLDWKLERSVPRAAVYATRLSAGDFALTLKARVDFDGFIYFTGQLEGKTPIESLKLIVPLRSDRVSHYHASLFETDAVKTYRKYGYRGGTIESYPQAFPTGFLPFVGLFWLGGDDGGIQWIAQWDKGWHNADREKVMTVARNGTTTALEVSFVDEPTTLGEPLPIDFAFAITPVKDMSYYWDKKMTVVYGGSDAIKPTLYDPQKLKADLELDRQNGATHVMTGGWGFPFHSDIWVRDHNRPHYKDKVDAIHAAGLKFIYYGCWAYSAYGEESKDFAQDMIKLPVHVAGPDTYWYNAEGPWVDFFMAGLDTAIKDYGIDGIYLDMMACAHMVADPLLGQTYTDEKGNAHGRYPIWALREWALRMINVMHITHRTDGVVYQHQSGSINLAIHSLADLRNTGEEAPSTYSLKQSWPVESFTARYNNHFFGVPSEILWYNWWNRPLKENQVWSVVLLDGQMKNHEAAQYIRPSDADYELMTLPTRTITNLLQGMDISHAQWWPYYGRNKWISLSPSRLYASSYVQPGKKALVVVSNMEKAPVRAKMTFDLTKTGFTAGKIKVTDAFLKTDIPVSGATVGLDVQGERYRLLMVEVKSE